MKRALYVVRDTVADDLGSFTTIHRAEAAAIRQFADAINSSGTAMNKHPEDFELIRLGYLTEDHILEPDKAVIITGQQYIATQAPQLVKEA